MKFYLTVAILISHITTNFARKIVLVPKIKVHQFNMPVRDISAVTVSGDTTYLLPFLRYGRNFEMITAFINFNPPMTFGADLLTIKEESTFGPLVPYATGIDPYTGELTI